MVGLTAVPSPETALAASAAGAPDASSPTARRGLRARHPAAAFVIRRIAAAVVTLLVLSALIFAATNLLPGNVAETVLGRTATPQTVHALDDRLELDKPITARYLQWLGGVVHGDLGDSAVAAAENAPDPSIADSIGAPLKNSLILAAITTALLIPLTLLLGALAGLHAQRKTDHMVSTPALIFAALPEFVTATLLIVVFFAWLDLLPPVSIVGPNESPFSDSTILVLPVATLLLATLGAGVRQVRAGVIEVLREDYVHVAQLNGLRGRVLLWRYVLRNALAPSVQIIAQMIQYLIGGIIVVEAVFSYPGIGTYLVQAVTQRDVTVVQATVIILAAVYILINLLADLIVVFLVPKLRTEMS